MSLRDGGDWDRQLEGGLPDSRLSGSARERTVVVRLRMRWERVFCANCGADGGLITADWSPHVFYLCNGCAAACGAPPGAVEADEAAVRGIHDGDSLSRGIR